MKTKLAFLILLIFVSISSQAQLLYKIEGKDLQKPSYIYGTIHIMPKKQFVISESITTALKECETLVMEVDINMDLKTQIDVAQRSLLPDGKTIADITSVENAQNSRKVRRECMGDGDYEGFLRHQCVGFCHVGSHTGFGPDSASRRRLVRCRRNHRDGTAPGAEPAGSANRGFGVLR